MALSGTFYTNFGGYYRLQQEWNATQNAANNTSYIETRLYLVSLNSSSAIYSSTSKTATLTIDGNSVPKTAAGLASLSGGQKKLIHTTQLTVTHNSSGERSVPLSGSMEVEVTLNGSYVGSVSTSGTAVLNKIARNSTLASSPNLRAGNAWGISISRASTAYTHDVRLYVDGTGITTATNVGASRTHYFTTSELTEIFRTLEGKSSGETRVVVITYDSAGNTVGSWSTHYGTMTKPSPSTLSNVPSSVNVGDTINFDVTRNLGAFTHTVSLVRNGVTYKSVTGVGYSGSLSTSDIANTLNNEIGDANYGNFALVTETFYNGVSVGGTTNSYLSLYPQTDPPYFAGNYTYEDTDSIAPLVTGNDQVIVSRYSNLMVRIPSTAKATGRNGAYIDRYDVTFGGYTRSVKEASGDLSVAFVNPYITGNTILTVTAVDSRGNEASVSKTVAGIPYNPPKLSADVSRAGGFGDTVTITSSGSVSSIVVGGTNQNDAQTLRYRYKPSSSSYWGTWRSIPFTQTSTTFTGYDQTLTLTNTSAYDFEVMMEDRLSSSTISMSIAPGQPLLFVDKAMNSVGVNRFPTGSNRFEVGGSIYSTGSINTDTDMSVGDDLTVGGDITATRLNLTSTYDASPTSSLTSLIIGNPTSGASMKMDTEELNSYYSGNSSTLYLNRDGGNVYINSTRFRFSDDGVFYRTSYREPNGHNVATIRDGTSTHTSQMMIQNVKVRITVSGQSYIDISFPESFDADPIWVIASAEESNSSAYNITAYNITRYGARIYGAHIHNDSRSFTFTASVVACGRKS